MERFSSIDFSNPYSFGLAVFRSLIAKKELTEQDLVGVDGRAFPPKIGFERLCTLFEAEAALMLKAHPEWGDPKLDYFSRVEKDVDPTFEYIVRRQVAPTHRGVILNYVKTPHPTPGEVVYDGEFIGRMEVWGFNEPVRARVFEPVGEITARVFQATEVKRYIVQRVFSPGIPRYIKTDQPTDGELVFYGQFLERSVTFADSVRAEICEPIGDVISQKYSAKKLLRNNHR
jgi:hypothetical protein